MRELFGYRVASLEMTRKRPVETDLFADPGELCEYYKANFGPTIAVYANVAAEPERTAALDRDFAEFAERWNRGAGSCHPPAFLPLSIAARASSSERALHSARYEVNKHYSQLATRETVGINGAQPHMRLPPASDGDRFSRERLATRRLPAVAPSASRERLVSAASPSPHPSWPWHSG